ncbi:hypothetical protein AB840_01885 [Megasphaera cerevisiae DSM 20462]|uniref:Glycosyltransferase n=1 Tax=Megasphaera cerevisiae DSM 20462 TaxID=1122219 RepID=A0A0J6X0I1_9FIRM|nr:glycosyltransferase [Megasphaera cerevisiae]KMO87667.1 hypothetical protein AB840_01885 [Megasphaera cerevisiae DSM 20462]SKA06766.1 Glycosyltransferase involved in cell wall bisynthesis [Megasphaera cerevisiae DSM 20462]
MRKKIIHILNTGTYSGAENVAITIVKNMRLQYNYDFIYVSLEGDIRNVCENNDIIFAPIKRMTISEVRRIIKQYKPDIIHAHDFTASVICANSVFRIPVISHLHNNSPWLKKYCFYSFAYLLSCLNINKILMVSKSILNEYVFGNLIRNKSIIISNPIDIYSIQQKAKLGKRKHSVNPVYDIIFLGRLSAPKNPQRFIEIISQVKENYPDIKVAMIGIGPLEDECINLIKEKKMDFNISLLGFMKNPYGILADAKMLCITSEWEGFGLVAVEALSLGIPVLATPVGGLPDIINSNCGALCKNNDQFVVEICKLLYDSVYWHEKSKNAFIQAQHLHNIQKYIAIINEIYCRDILERSYN